MSRPGRYSVDAGRGPTEAACHQVRAGLPLYPRAGVGLAGLLSRRAARAENLRRTDGHRPLRPAPLHVSQGRSSLLVDRPAPGWEFAPMARRSPSKATVSSAARASRAASAEPKPSTSSPSFRKRSRRSRSTSTARRPSSSAAGKLVWAIADFGATPGEAVLVKIGLSAVSVDGARANLKAEIPGMDFDQISRDARDAWQHQLAGSTATSPTRPTATPSTRRSTTPRSIPTSSATSTARSTVPTRKPTPRRASPTTRTFRSGTPSVLKRLTDFDRSRAYGRHGQDAPRRRAAARRAPPPLGSV